MGMGMDDLDLGEHFDPLHPVAAVAAVEVVVAILALMLSHATGWTWCAWMFLIHLGCAIVVAIIIELSWMEGPDDDVPC